MHLVTSPSSQQTWSAEGYERNARFVSDLGGAVFDWLAPAAGETILDVGCGDGALTRRIAETGADVTGVDSSPQFIAAARQRGIEAHLGDAQDLDFDRRFDAVFSNAALHWMTRPADVVAGVARALKPGGRFVAEFGGHGNVAAIVTAMRAMVRIHGGDTALANPWYFPTPGEYSQLLADAGFTIDEIALVPRPTPLPTGLAGWLQTFRQPFFDQYAPDVRTRVLAEIEHLLRPALCDSGGNWTADYVRLRVRSRLTDAT
ncbi:MAG: methyltransferase domain-containing protein [Rhodobiaceae bacterium]|nr:methyltransferase domain-containing protein [Rhodobiaceae bacterium]